MPHPLITYSQYNRRRVSPIIAAQSQPTKAERLGKPARVSGNETVGELRRHTLPTVHLKRGARAAWWAAAPRPAVVTVLPSERNAGSGLSPCRPRTHLSCYLALSLRLGCYLWTCCLLVDVHCYCWYCCLPVVAGCGWFQLLVAAASSSCCCQLLLVVICCF